MVFCESEGGDDVIDVWKYVKKSVGTEVCQHDQDAAIRGNSGDNEKRFQTNLGYSLGPTSAEIVA